MNRFALRQKSEISCTDVFKVGQLGQKNKTKEFIKESCFYNTIFFKAECLNMGNTYPFLYP